MQYGLIGITYLLALVGLFKDSFPARVKRHIGFVALVFLSISVFGQIYVEWTKASKERYAKWSGKLSSLRKSDAKAPALVIGGATVLHWDGGPDQPMTKDELGEPLFLRLIDGEAQLSLIIRDAQGKPFVLMRDNVWSVVPPPATFDRNFNDHALEVLDAKGDPVFQVIIEGHKVHIAMRSFTKEGKTIGGFGPWLHQVQGRQGTLFRYPSSEYPGEWTAVTK